MPIPGAVAQLHGPARGRVRESPPGATPAILSPVRSSPMHYPPPSSSNSSTPPSKAFIPPPVPGLRRVKSHFVPKISMNFGMSMLGPRIEHKPTFSAPALPASTQARARSSRAFRDDMIPLGNQFYCGCNFIHRGFQTPVQQLAREIVHAGKNRLAAYRHLQTIGPAQSLVASRPSRTPSAAPPTRPRPQRSWWMAEVDEEPMRFRMPTRQPPHGTTTCIHVRQNPPPKSSRPIGCRFARP